MVKPNTAQLNMTFNSVNPTFDVTYEDGSQAKEFVETSNILLHDVIIDEYGTISGTYIKPESLNYYENNINKEIYPTYFEWCAFSDDREKLFNDDENIFISSEVLMNDGIITPEFECKVTRYNKVYFQIRTGFNQTYASINMIIYK